MSRNSLQCTPEWYNSRLFRFTSSELYKLLSEPREKAKREAGELSDQAKTYIYDKLSETITNGTILDYKDINTREVVWGKENEITAILEYEKRTGYKVIESPFIPYKDFFGGSPDGLVDTDGFIEVKCPFNGSIHVKYLLFESQEELKKEKPDYYAQIQGNFIVTKRSWCDFISFDPRVQETSLSLKILRVYPDIDFMDKSIQKLERSNQYKIHLMDKLIKLIA